METNVRIHRSKNSGQFEHLTMDVLMKPKHSSYFRPIGTITWQGDTQYGWYALRFNVNAEINSNKDLLDMYKLSCYVKDRVKDESPQEVMGIMGGVEHFYTYGRYVSIQEHGKQMYEVRRNGDASLYTTIIAANDVMADRILQGMVRRKELPFTEYKYEPTGARLVFTPTDLSIATTRDLTKQQ